MLFVLYSLRMFKKRRTYLDWAASALVLRSAARAYSRALASHGNPSSSHEEGRAAKTLLEDARATIARELSMKADDIIFTSGATEANNIAMYGVVTAAKTKGGNPHVLYLASAHASTVETVRALSRWGVVSEPLPIKDGEVDIKKMMGLVRPETMLVSMDFVCSETGTVWNTREVRHALPEHVYLHVDATQAPLEESLERTRIGGDLITLDAQKIGGVRGTGVLAASRTVPLIPLLYGGGQERTVRPGTESVAGAVAFAIALTEAREGRERFSLRAHNMRADFLTRISGIKNTEVNQGKKGIAHILNLSFIGRDTDYLAALLNEAGFAVSTKSACESDSSDGSRAVFALTGDKHRALSTLRISWGPATHASELSRFADALIKAVAFLDAHPA